VIPRNLAAAIVMKKQKEAKERFEKVNSLVKQSIDPKVIPFPGSNDEMKD
jgi:hypothetical protein